MISIRVNVVELRDSPPILTYSDALFTEYPKIRKQMIDLSKKLAQFRLDPSSITELRDAFENQLTQASHDFNAKPAHQQLHYTIYSFPNPTLASPRRPIPSRARSSSARDVVMGEVTP
jgi:hypothetical protein